VLARAVLLGALALAAGLVPARAETARERCAAGYRDGDAASCAEALDREPDDVGLRRNYARSLYVAGAYLAALMEYREVVSRAPGEARSHLDLAGAYGSLRQYHDAIDPIEEAMRLAPDDLIVLRTAAIIYREVDRDADAHAAELHSAELGDMLAMYELSQNYKYGIGTTVDGGESVRWLKRAAEAGHIFAMKQLAEVYLEGLLGQEVDEARALEWAARAHQALEAE